jgi:hypothetical protein
MLWRLVQKLTRRFGDRSYLGPDPDPQSSDPVSQSGEPVPPATEAHHVAGRDSLDRVYGDTYVPPFREQAEIIDLAAFRRTRMLHAAGDDRGQKVSDYTAEGDQTKSS